MPSIRHKITFGYYLFAACIIGLAVFAYANLRFMEQRLDWGTAVSSLLDTTLEMRRFEKNFFLYGKSEDAASAQAYAGAALSLLEENTAAYREFAATADLQHLREQLERYSERIAPLVRMPGENSAARNAIEADIRKLGHELATSAERISANEHDVMRTLLSTARDTVVGLLIAVTLFSLVLAHVLTWIVVRPLRRLEDDLQDIGQGRISSLPAYSREQEIVSFTQAFNRTLHELEVRRRHLLQSEKLASLGTLVSGVAHELNNPLSNISTSTQLLLEELASADRDQIRAWLSDVEEQTERARRIVASLLDFSRDNPFVLIPTSLRNVLDKSVMLMGAQRSKGRCEIINDIAPEIFIDADVQKLQQVFVNLLGNAMDAGARNIRVQAPVCMSGDDYEHYVWTQVPVAGGCGTDMLCVAVNDDGPGIAAELLPKLFDPFFTTKDVGYGSGLGLYVVEKIIRQHNGSVGVSSASGVGTTFLIRFPHRHATETTS